MDRSSCGGAGLVTSKKASHYQPYHELCIAEMKFNKIFNLVLVFQHIFENENSKVKIQYHPGLAEIFAPDGVTGSDIIS